MEYLFKKGEVDEEGKVSLTIVIGGIDSSEVKRIIPKIKRLVTSLDGQGDLGAV
jgi:hypothetical protein